MKFLNVLTILLLLTFISKSYANDHNNILSYFNEIEEYSYFLKLIKKANY